MTRHHISISGVSVADGVPDEVADEIYKLYESMTQVRGVGPKTAAEILAEYPTRDELEEAGVSRITDIEGVGESTASEILNILSQDGWSAELSVSVEYSPDDDAQYTVSVGRFRTERGNRLLPTLSNAIERLPEQRVIDDLREDAETE